MEMKLRFKAILMGLFSALGASAVLAADSAVVRIVAHYSDDQLNTIHTVILPRSFLYDEHNQLVPDEKWPSELASVKVHKDDGRCCLAYDQKPTEKGPPAECAKPAIGDANVADITGLMDSKGQQIATQDIPPHKFLLVVYAAKWCTPCVVEEKRLKQIFAASSNASDYTWLTVDMTRITEVKDAAKKAVSH